MEGKGVTVNQREGAKWLRLAAESGDVSAQFQLAEYLSDKHTMQAISWYEIAAENGHPEAQFKLFAYYSNGVAIPKNEEKALQWLEASAENGNLKARRILEQRSLAQTNDGSSTTESGSKMRKMFKSARQLLNLDSASIN